MAPGSLFARLFADAFALMRERWIVYAIFALICAIAGAPNFQEHHSKLLEVAAIDPGRLIRILPINVIASLDLIAIFFVLPSAVRLIDSTFQMTFWRGVLAIVTIVCIALITDAGFVAAVIPGFVLMVLLSQGLVVALLLMPARATARDAAASLVGSFRGSFELTRGRFATTAGVVALSFAIVVIPSVLVFIAMIALQFRLPDSLVVFAPLLLLTFIYFECVRYTLVVRWYGRLKAGVAAASSAASSQSVA